MSTAPTFPIAPGSRIPPLVLREAGSDKRLPVRAPQLGSLVLFVAHGAECGPCREYLRVLERSAEGFRIWGGRAIAVVPGAEAAASRTKDELALGFPVAVDPGEETPGGVPPGGVPPGEAREASVTIADRFGECFHSVSVGPEHQELPDASEVEEWLRYLGTQCPECGVPDTAERGGWV